MLVNQSTEERRWWSRVVLAGLLVFLATVVAAQEPSQEPEEPVATTVEQLTVAESLPYVPSSNTIATKLAVPLEWTPANVGVVPAARIEESAARSLEDVLSAVSGLHAESGAGVFDYFVVRGFDSLSGAQILTDGAPEPESTFYQLYNVERVEVLKGPGGFLYGANPLAGAVNLVRKQPEPGHFATVGLRGASYDTAELTFDGNLGTPDASRSFRLNGLYRKGDAYRDDLENEITLVNPSFSFRPSERLSINVNFEGGKAEFTPDAGLPVLSAADQESVPRTRSYGAAGDFSEQDLLRAQVDVEYQISDSLRLRDKLYHRGLDWQTQGTLLVGTFAIQPQTLAVARTSTELDDEQATLGNQLELVWQGTTGAVEHHLLAGVEYARSTDRYTLDAALIGAALVADPRITFGGVQPIFASRGDAETIVLAPYVIDQLTLSKSFQVLVGARWDEIDFTDEVTHTERNDGELSPMVGAVWQARPGLSVYGNWSESFAPASTRVVGPREPETSRQTELGLRHNLWGGRLRATLAAYRLERENIAIPDDNGFTEQAGDQRSEGFELELAGDLAPGLRGFFTYAWNDSELTRFRELVQVPFPPYFFVLDRTGNRPSFAPESLASLWLSQRVGAWTLAGGARFVDERFTAEDNAVALDAYTLVALSLARDWGAYRFSVNLDNLTDQDYELRGFGSSAFIPGDPLSVSIGAQYRWAGGE